MKLRSGSMTIFGAEAVPSCPEDGGLGCGRGSRPTIAPLVLSDVGHVVVTVAAPDHGFVVRSGRKQGGFGVGDEDRGGGCSR
jgi:hypothetical protein